MSQTLQHVSEQVQTIKDALGRAIILRAEGRYEEALKHHEETYELVKGVPHQLRKWWAGVGRTHRLMGYPLKALDAYKEASRIPVQDSEDREVAAGILSNIANALIDLKRPQEARTFIDRAEAAHRDSVHRDWLGEILECRARAFYLEERFDEATEAAERAVEILRHCDGQRALNEARLTLAACWEAKQRSVKQ